MKNNFRKRILTLVLTLSMLLGSVGVLRIPVAAAVSAENEGKVKITVKWRGSSGELFVPGTEATLVDVMVYASGKANETVEVTLASFAISAVEGEFEKAEKTLTLTTDANGEASQRTYFSIYPQKTPVVQSGYGTIQRHQFGVSVIRTSDNAYVYGNNFLRSMVGASEDKFIELSPNNTGFYDFNAGTAGVINNGYTISSAHSLHSSKNAQFTTNAETTTYEGYTYYKIPYSLDGSVTRYFRFTGDASPYKILYNSVTDYDANSKQMKTLFDSYPYLSNEVYVGGSFFTPTRIAMASSYLQYAGYAEGSTPTRIFGKDLGAFGESPTYVWIEHTWYFDGTESTIKRTAIIRRGNYDTFAHIGRSNLLVEFTNSPLTGGLYTASTDMLISDLVYYAAIIDDTRPVIESISVTGPEGKTYVSGDEMYIAVKMSKIVQIDEKADLSKLVLSARVGSAQSSDILNFEYVDGHQTDTLIFKTKLDDKEREVEKLYVSSIGFRAGASGNSNHIADMFLNEKSTNNPADFTVGSKGEVSCKIDTRVPKINYLEAVGEAKKLHQVGLSIGKISVGAEIFYMWSRELDDLQRPLDDAGWRRVEYKKSEDLIVSGSGYDGEYYLHVAVRGVNGLISRQTIQSKENSYNKYLFDNTAPTVTVAPGDQGLGSYELEHKIELQIVDHEKLSEVKNVWYRVLDANGTPTDISSVSGYVSDAAQPANGYVHIFGSGSSAAMTKDKDSDVFTFTLAHDKAGVPQSTFAEYSVEFLVEDAAGNVTSPFKISPVMYDNRVTFPINYTAKYGEADAERVPSEYSVNDYSIYYASNETTPLTVKVTGVDVTPGELYSVYYLSIDGREIYDKRKTPNESLDFAAAGLATAPKVENINGQMVATLTFERTAAGRYDIGFMRGTDHPSDFLTVYISPEEAETPNYKKLYDEQRLLITSVWKFATGTFYDHGATTQKGYDGTAEKNVPIFSDHTAALEYARFKEYFDIELVCLDMGTAELLNTGGSAQHQKAEGDKTKTATVGQTWIRYKSESWMLGSAGQEGWVYYYYSDQRESTLNITLDASGKIVLPNASLEAALEANAEKIAGGGALYLTRNNANVDAFGTPSYPKSAIFYAQETLTGLFEMGGAPYTAVYAGDKDIYSSFVTMPAEGTDIRMPIVANYTFDISRHGQVYYRLAGTASGEWTALLNGQTLKSLISASGIYEIKEIGGGYRHYYIFCDLDAPLAKYTYERKGEETGSSGIFADMGSAISFRATKVSLKHLLDAAHRESAYPVEYDAHSYIYLTQSGAGGFIEETKYFFTMDQLNSQGFDVPAGRYKLHICDRLGNNFAVEILTNGTELIVTEPSVIKNTSVTFYINRDPHEIKTFYIERIGTASTERYENYARELTFRQSGIYYLYVEDIFGEIATREVTLERDPPTAVFAYKSAGGYIQMTPLEADDPIPATPAYVKKAPNSVFTINSSTDIRIAYNPYAGYEFSVSPTDVAYTERTSQNYTYVEIPVSNKAWTLTLSYRNDSEARIVITCINDTEAPSIKAEASFKEYIFNEDSGNGNVLLYDSGRTTTQLVASGERANAQSLKYSWSDGSGCGVEFVTLEHNGKKTQLDPKVGTHTVTAAGDYVLTVRDLLGNESVHKFKLSSVLDFAAALGDKTLDYEKDPLSKITGQGSEAVFGRTDHTGRELSLTLRESLTLTFVRKTAERSFTYEMAYDGEKLSFVRHTTGMGAILPDVRDLTGSVKSGTLFGTDELRIEYSKGKDGLVISFPSSDLAYELLQLRVSDAIGSSAYILQVERSNVLPKLVPIMSESREEIKNANAQSFTGINEGFTLTGSLDGIVSVKAYRSEKYTLDFSGTSEKNTYDMITSGLITGISDEGYYKIVVTNKYGNEQVMLIRVNFGSDVDALIEYRDIDAREFVFPANGKHTLYSNRSVSIRIWDGESRATVKRGTEDYTPVIRQANGCLELIFSEYGEYTVTVKDTSGNELVLVLDIKAPAELAYRDYLTGFNVEAILRAENYTNAPLSLSYENMQANGVLYAAVTPLGKSEWSLLYDMISQSQLDRTEGNFNNSIGRENGSYTVMFTDRYGNVCRTDVHISNKTQLYISRTTKNSAGNMGYHIPDILVSGVWSNYIVTMRNDSEAYSLTVNGESASFNAAGEYICELPFSLGDTAEAEYKIVYIDSYGNKYEFTVHLMRKTPVIQELIDESQKLTIRNSIYVRGDFAYDWSDETMTAVYVRDGAPVVYNKGTPIAEDGVYTFTFTDIAGNIDIRVITRDTVVSYSLGCDDKTVLDGVAVSGNVRINERGENVNVIKVLKNGKEITATRFYAEHGAYEITVSDDVGNTATVTFDIFSAPTKAFTYTSRGVYAIYQVWYYRDGQRQPYGNIIMTDDGHQEFTFYEDGDYEVELLEMSSNSYHTFKVTVDTVAPAATLVGEITDGITRANITLEGLEDGDTVRVIRNGKLVTEYRKGSAGDPPIIREAGEYEIVIFDEAGNETVYKFTRKYTTNAASNALICIALLSVSVGAVIFLRSRGKVRTK